MSKTTGHPTTTQPYTMPTPTKHASRSYDLAVLFSSVQEAVDSLSSALASGEERERGRVGVIDDQSR